MTAQDPGATPPRPGDEDATAPLPTPGDAATPPAEAAPPPEPMPGYPASTWDAAPPPSEVWPPQPAGAEPPSSEVPPAPPPDIPPSPWAPPSAPAGPLAPGAYPPNSFPPGSYPPGGLPPGGYTPGGGGPAMAWAPPPSAVTAGPGVAGLIYAGTLARVVAWILDTILLGIITSIVTAPFANRFAAFDPTRPGVIPAVSPVAVIITIGVSALYFIGFWTSGWRATPAMKLLKLQVGDAATGRTLSPEQGLRRWIGFGDVVQLLGVVPALAAAASGAVGLWALILLLTTATHPAHQGLHDRFASTAVVQPYGVSSAPVILGCLILLVVIPLLAIIALIFLGGQVSSILSEVGTSVQSG